MLLEQAYENLYKRVCSNLKTFGRLYVVALFYEILSAKAGLTIRTDGELLKLLIELSEAKQQYDKVADALSAVRATGYGVVMPTAEEMKMEKPEVLKKGSKKCRS